MLNFILGLLVGGLCGAVVMILAQSAKAADEEMPKAPDNTEQKEQEKQNI